MAYYTLSVLFLKGQNIGTNNEEVFGVIMKHVFIINPNAGRKSKLEEFCNNIKKTAEKPAKKQESKLPNPLKNYQFQKAEYLEIHAQYIITL